MFCNNFRTSLHLQSSISKTIMEQERKTLVFYPSPGTGHLGSMVEFAKLVVTNHPSFSITILLNTLPGMPQSAFDSLIASAPSLTFLRLQSLPITKASSSLDSFVEMSYEIPRLSCPEIRQVLETMSRESNLKAFCIDFFCNAAFEVSASLGIPTYFFYTSGGCGLTALLSVPAVQRAAEASHDPHLLISIPGLPPFPISHYPKICLEGSSKLFEATSINMLKSRGIITNTFRALEGRTLGAISEGPTPPVYCTGPLIGAYDRTPGGHECLTWLDSQPRQSVVFLCFGSMGVLTKKQLKEMAIGLESSGHRFLWVVRNPPGEEREDELFPTGFVERTRERGLVVKDWAPQVAVLRHDSVGGFVTHCGWNSVLEAVCAGVPMVARPLYAEQRINATGLVGEMRVALGLDMSEEEEDGFVSAAELERRVRELMDSDSASGREVRERVGAMKEAATTAMAEGGSSLVELAHLVGEWN